MNLTSDYLLITMRPTKHKLSLEINIIIGRIITMNIRNDKKNAKFKLYTSFLERKWENFGFLDLKLYRSSKLTLVCPDKTGSNRIKPVKSQSPNAAAYVLAANTTSSRDSILQSTNNYYSHPPPPPPPGRLQTPLSRSDSNRWSPTYVPPTIKLVCRRGSSKPQDSNHYASCCNWDLMCESRRSRSSSIFNHCVDSSLIGSKLTMTSMSLRSVLLPIHSSTELNTLATFIGLLSH